MTSKFLTSAALALFLSPGLVRSEPILMDRVVAEVNGEVITLSEVSERVERVERELSREMDAETFQREATSHRSKALAAMIDEILILQEAPKLEIVIEEEQINSALENVRKESNVTSDAQFQYMLQAQNFTMQEYRDFLKRQMTMLQVRRKALGAVQVTDEEIKSYYDANKEDFRRAASVHLRHILLRVPEDAGVIEVDTATRKAAQLRTEIQGGADFATVAQVASEDPSASKGGDIGVLNSGQMLPEFEKVAFTLPLNEVSEPVRTKYGIHLIQVIERAEGSFQPIEEVSERLRQFLQDRRVQGKQEEWLSKIREQAYVKIYERPQPPAETK